MKFAIFILAVLAAVSAQDSGKYKPYNYNPYNYNAFNYNPFNYNRNYNNYNAFEPYNRQPYYDTQDYYRSTYRPYFSTTPAPFVSSTFTPPIYPSSTIAPPIVPVIPNVVPVVPKIYSNGAEANAEILRLDKDSAPDGSYSFAYETSNGIAAQEQGTPRNFGGNPPVAPIVAQGSFTWTSPEGRVVSISYIADENGYHPVGDAIPTPPPVPPQIARALEYIARNAPAAKK